MPATDWSDARLHTDGELVASRHASSAIPGGSSVQRRVSGLRPASTRFSMALSQLRLVLINSAEAASPHR